MSLTTPLAYGFAVAAVAAASAVRVGLHPVLGDSAPYFTYAVAAVLTMLLGGWGPALLAIILGLVCGNYLFVSQRNPFSFNLEQGFTGGIFVLGTLIFIALLDGVRHAKAEAGAARDKQRELELVREERDRMEARLREMRERLEATIAAVEIGTWTWKLPGDRVVIDRSLQALFGLSETEAAEATAETYFSRIHPADQASVVAAVSAAIQQGTPYSLECRVLRPDGSMRWISTLGRTQMKTGGEPLEFNGVALDITERKMAEAALRESEAMLSTLLEQIPVGIGLMNEEGRWMISNAVMRRFAAEVIPPRSTREGMSRRVMNEEGNLLGNADWPGERALRGETVPGRDLLCVMENGEEVWTRVSAAPFLNPDGKLCGAITVIQDIDEQKRTEKELQLRLDELNTLLDLLPVGVWVGNRDCSEIYCNRAAYEIFGWAPGMNTSLTAWQSHVPGNLRALVNGVEVAPTDLPMQRVARTGVPVRNLEHEIVMPDSTVKTVYANASPVLDERGKVRLVIAAYADITERKRAEAELRLSEYRYAMAQRAAGIGSWEWNMTTGALYWSEQIEPMFGMASGTFGKTYRSFLERVHPEDRRLVLEAVSVAISQGREYKAEHRIIWPDGTVRWVSESGELQRNAEGAPTRMFGIVRDVTERKRSEEALTAAQEQLRQHAAKLEETVRERTAELRNLVDDLEHFSFSLTHDLRAPLRAMNSFTQLLLEEGCLDCPNTESKGFLRRILTASRRMDALITDALDYSRAVRSELVLAPVDVAGLLRGIIQSYPNLQDAKITLTGRFPLVMGNEAALTQCFSNLLGNAVKFVAPGTPPCISVRAETRGSYVRLWFEDNGIGIAPEHQGRLFEMFFRANPKYEGTGIGLALVRKNTEKMSGKVGVESAVGIGSRFWLEIPLAVNGSDHPERFGMKSYPHSHPGLLSRACTPQNS